MFGFALTPGPSPASRVRGEMGECSLLKRSERGVGTARGTPASDSSAQPSGRVAFSPSPTPLVQPVGFGRVAPDPTLPGRAVETAPG
jgi:hypothetical protein